MHQTFGKPHQFPLNSWFSSEWFNLFPRSYEAKIGMSHNKEKNLCKELACSLLGLNAVVSNRYDGCCCLCCLHCPASWETSITPEMTYWYSGCGSSTCRWNHVDDGSWFASLSISKDSYWFINSSCSSPVIESDTSIRPGFIFQGTCDSGGVYCFNSLLSRMSNLL